MRASHSGEEDLHVRFSQCTPLSCSPAHADHCPPTTGRSGHAHAVVGQVGQGRSARSGVRRRPRRCPPPCTRGRALDAGELAPRRLLEQGRGEVEQVDQRLGTRRAATERLELGTGRADLGHVPLVWPGVQQADIISRNADPADLAVLHRDQGVALVELLSDFGRLVDELALDREADAGAAHQDVEDLVEGAHVVHGDVRAVVAGHFVAIERRAGGHEGAHGGHGAERTDGLC